MLTDSALSAHNTNPAHGRERFTIRKTFGGGRMFKRSYALLALLVIAGMSLAACGPAASAFECTDTLGCVDIGPTAPIHLAYPMVINGPHSTLGIDSRTGVEVAIALKGKVLGHDVQLTGEDDGCCAEGGQAAGTKLAADPSIV